MKLWQYARGGERLKATRSYFGMSGNETAKQMGIPSGTYSSYERQITEPSVETLEKFCDLFGMEIADLFYVEPLP